MRHVKLNDRERSALKGVQAVNDRCPDPDCDRCLDILVGTVQNLIAVRVDAAISWRGAQS